MYSITSPSSPLKHNFQPPASLLPFIPPFLSPLLSLPPPSYNFYTYLSHIPITKLPTTFRFSFSISISCPNLFNLSSLQPSLMIPSARRTSLSVRSSSLILQFMIFRSGFRTHFRLEYGIISCHILAVFAEICCGYSFAPVPG